jgi:hypothetical protein
MRTTLTLDDDVARELRKAARSSGRSFKEVVNAALRRGLASGETPPRRLPRFQVEARSCGFRPGVDIYRLNRLSDEIETEDLERKLSSRVAEP